VEGIKYRDRIDIVSQVLEIANGGDVTKSKIMYKAFLSHNQLKQYLTVLTGNDLLSYDLVSQTFKTTEKGLRYLDAYNQIGDIVKALQ
jgi:predicted transcriptional regulator